MSGDYELIPNESKTISREVLRDLDEKLGALKDAVRQAEPVHHYRNYYPEYSVPVVLESKEGVDAIVKALPEFLAVYEKAYREAMA